MANQSQTEDLYIIMEPGFELLCGFDPANVVMYKPYYKEKNRPASTEYIAEKNLEAQHGDFGNSYARRSIDSPLVNYMEDDILDRVVLDALIEKAATLSPKHGEIFKLLFDYDTQQAIADELGMKQRTVSDKVKAIRELLAPDIR